jgi:glycosyltransferase involved in cell wall biosynthesis
MRIGIDATALWSGATQSGITGYTIQIVEHLLKTNSSHDYYVYSFNEVPERLAAVPASVRFRVFKTWNRKLWQQTVLPLAAWRDRLDLMFFPSNSVAKFLPCASVATIHDLHPFVVPNAFRTVHRAEVYGNRLRSSVSRWYWRWVLAAASRKDRVIAVSETTKSDIEKILAVQGDAIDVVYEGVDHDRFGVGEEGGEIFDAFLEKYRLPQRYILCVGTHGYKNLQGAIKAFYLVKQQRKNSLRMVVAGNKHTLGGEILGLVQDLGLAEEIVFTGFVADEDMRSLYRCAEMLLFPSHYEGFGLPLLEAFACGTPVVTSRTGAMPEVAGSAALLVDPDDPTDIASAVSKILDDPNLREAKRRQGLARVRMFSWEEAGRKTLGVLEKALDAKQRL